jgi:biphenyl 2,3-dioxygenase beta subunit
MTYAPDRQSIELRLLVEDLLYYESSLISDHQLEKWTELLHDEIRYWIPVRTNRGPGAEDLNRPYLMCHIDDDKQTLVMRARRVAGGFSFADNPAPRARHFVTNVRIVASEGDTIAVTSNVIVWRSHVGLPDHALWGCRHDRWLRNQESWLLLERQVVLDVAAIPGIGVLF